MQMYVFVCGTSHEVPFCSRTWKKPTINTDRVFQVSIGALKGDLMILRGAAQRPPRFAACALMHSLRTAMTGLGMMPDQRR